MKLPIDVDDDALIAATDLAKRSGATEFEIGYLRDEETEGHPVRFEDAGWYAKCNYKGVELNSGEKSRPDEAADALSRRILSGGQCTHCKKTVTLSSHSEGCHWRRMGERWERGCIEPPARRCFFGSGRSVSI